MFRKLVSKGVNILLGQPVEHKLKMYCNYINRTQIKSPHSFDVRKSKPGHTLERHNWHKRMGDTKHASQTSLLVIFGSINYEIRCINICHI